jgi:predicted kinase
MSKNCIILMGLPCSGKSTWLKENETKLEGYHIVSADELKEKHPEYKPEDTEGIHEWSVRQAEFLMYQNGKNGVSLIMDGGGINNSYTKRIINKMKNFGYHIKLVHIKTPYTICIERNEKRERKVPKRAIVEKAVRETPQFYILKELVDEVEVCDYFTYKNIFVDMDGILAGLSTLPIIDGEIDFVNNDVHKNLKPVLPVIQKLLELKEKGHRIYILSAVPNSFCQENKNDWLDSHFNIPPEHRFFVNQGRYKAEMLEGLVTKLKLNKKDVVMLDDTHSVLYDTEKRGMRPMHVSEFLTFNF